jgi:hypothetical protein
MRRVSQVMAGHLISACLALVCLPTLVHAQTMPAQAMPAQALPAESQVVRDAYEAVSRWLFDLYLNQSIRLTVANVSQARPDAPSVLGPQVPAIAKVLDRHRVEFVRAMQPPLRAHFSPTDVTAFAARLAKPNIELDDATRTRLIAVDGDFRRDSQKAIRALTFDLGTLVAEALAAAPANRQN